MTGAEVSPKEAGPIFLGENQDSIFLGSALTGMHGQTSAPEEMTDGSKRNMGAPSGGADYVPVLVGIPMHAWELIGQAIADAGDTARPSRALSAAASEPTPEVMNTDQVAAYIGRSKSSIYKLTATGNIPFIQDGPGCRCYFRRRDIDTWLCDQRG